MAAKGKQKGFRANKNGIEKTTYWTWALMRADAEEISNLKRRKTVLEGILRDSRTNASVAATTHLHALNSR
jgi:hypothetical protein